MTDLRSGPLQHALNNADNGDERSRQEALDMLRDHRWELHDALDALESLKIDLGLYALSTRQAAQIVPALVREIMQGAVNGRLLLRAVQAEQELAKLKLGLPGAGEKAETTASRVEAQELADVAFLDAAACRYGTRLDIPSKIPGFDPGDADHIHFVLMPIGAAARRAAVEWLKSQGSK
jgi:hypothetical protein